MEITGKSTPIGKLLTVVELEENTIIWNCAELDKKQQQQKTDRGACENANIKNALFYITWYHIKIKHQMRAISQWIEII